MILTIVNTVWLVVISALGVFGYNQLRALVTRVGARVLERDVQHVPPPIPLFSSGAGVPATAPVEDVQLSWPPDIDGDAVGDFLKHYARSGWTYAQVIKRFYTQMIADPVIRDYFPASVNIPELQKHFVNAFITVCNKGVFQSTVDAMREAHKNVRNSRGEPITEEVWKRSVAILANVLWEAGVPERAILSLSRTLAPLQAAIVQEIA